MFSLSHSAQTSHSVRQEHRLDGMTPFQPHLKTAIMPKKEKLPLYQDMHTVSKIEVLTDFFDFKYTFLW